MSDKVVSFRISKDSIRRVHFSEPVKHEVVHLYPNLLDYRGKSIPDGNNPRSHDEFLLTSAVAKSIRNTLVEHPEEFKAINRGLLVVAKNAHFDDARQEFTITLTDWERGFVEGITEIPKHGLADGGTTDQVIADMQKEGESLVDSEDKDEWLAGLRKAQIHMEVLVFDETEEDDIADAITRICQGRNTSQQVKSWSIADFEGNWDWLKNILNARYPEQIAFEENSKAKCKATVLDVLAILNLFHPYYQGNKSPTSSYSSKGSIQKLYETRQAGFVQLEPVVVSILELHDYIYANFQKAYRGEIGDESEEATKKSLKRYRSKDGKEVFKQHKAPKPLNFTDLATHLKVEPGMLFPVLAAFRALLQTNGDGKLKWFCDPKEFWDKNGCELMERLMDSFTQHKNNFNVLGRDANVYRFLYEAVQSKRDHEELSKLRAQIAKKR
jgi:hypothetical protein